MIRLLAAKYARSGTETVEQLDSLLITDGAEFICSAETHRILEADPHYERASFPRSN